MDLEGDQLSVLRLSVPGNVPEDSETVRLVGLRVSPGSASGPWSRWNVLLPVGEGGQNDAAPGKGAVFNPPGRLKVTSEGRVPHRPQQLSPGERLIQF